MYFVAWNGGISRQGNQRPFKIGCSVGGHKLTILQIQGSPLSMIFGTWKKLYYAKFVLVEYVVHRLNSTSTNLLITNSTSTTFIPIALKFILVEFLLVETVQVGDPL